MQALINLAETVKTELDLQYDSASVRYLEGFIERQKSSVSTETSGGFINSCGAFLGQCIIKNYGGAWTQDQNGQIAIAFDRQNMVYPFAKVSKQFDHGLEDSIYSFYTTIPIVFQLTPNTPHKWWQFWR